MKKLSNDTSNMQHYTDKCNKLLEQNAIRFAGIIDANGKLISGGFKEGLTPLEYY